MRSGRSEALDALRGLAILLVLGRHLPDIPSGSSPLLSAAQLWKRGGWIGVDLFFVLSGFLVSGLLFKEYRKRGSLDIGRFLIRRGFKIYPGYYLMLGASLLWMFDGLGWRDILAEALFFRNYTFHSYGFWEHTWSLAIEEHFYFSLAGVLWALCRFFPQRPFRAVPWICGAIGIFCLAGRLYGHGRETDAGNLFFFTHFRADSLSFGVLLSYFYHHHPDPSARWVAQNKKWLLPAALVTLSTPFLFAVSSNYFHFMWGLTAVYLACGALLILSVPSEGSALPWGGRFRSGLAFIGVYSYSIYLWHAPVRRVGKIFFSRYLGAPPDFWRDAAVYLVFSLCVGVLMAKALEMPMLRLRDRFFPSRG